jgi:hypothetical protein
MKKMILAALVLGAPFSAQAQSMSVSDFLVGAGKLEKRGVAAIFSSDYRLLKSEIKKAAVSLRADQAAALKAGRRPATCLPNPVEVEAGELIRHFRAIPVAQQRSTSVKAAFASLMNKKHPCRD